MSRTVPMRTAFILLRKKAICITTLRRKTRRKRRKENSLSRSGNAQRQGHRHRQPKGRGLQSRLKKPSALVPHSLRFSKAIPVDTSRHIISKNEVVGPTYEEGYLEGCAVGAEEAVSAQLPPYTLLPNVSSQEIITAGIKQYELQFIHLVHPMDVYQRLERALSLRQPMSLVRLGDGELLALAHETVLPLAEAQIRGPFLPYAGITIPDQQSREMLAESIRKSTMVGVPLSRLPSYQGLLAPVFSYYGIHYSQVALTSSTINYVLLELGLIQQLLQGRQVLFVGNMAGELASVLSNVGVNVGGIITPVKGFTDMPRVMAEAASIYFDIALVSSGIPAVVICQRIASELGRVALDFGHLANKLVTGEMSFNR